MTELPHLEELFQKLRVGYHLSPEDEPLFSTVSGDYDAYKSYFLPLGLNLIRHDRDFFYFQPDNNDAMRETLPRIAVFSFILIDHAASAGKPVEEFLLTEHFLISRLPHFSLDRYVGLLRQVDVENAADLRLILKNMERFGWVKFLGEEEFRFLRPFHRIFDKCLELSEKAQILAAQVNVGEK
jgi:hypothetical protein